MTYFDRTTKRIMRFKENIMQPKNQQEISIDSITMKELHFLYILYAALVTISIIVFAGEILIYKLMQFRREECVASI